MALGKFLVGREEEEDLTAFSACCWKCTKNTVPAAKREVPRRVSLEARDIVGGVAEFVGL